MASVFKCCKHCRQPANLTCTACDVIRYCCKDHQTRDWQAHKPFCKWLREELLKRSLSEKTPESKLHRKQQLAVTYWERLAVEGDADAQFNMGTCYHLGEGIDRAIDKKKAFEYYHLSAAQGHAMAQFSKGYCYDTGTGITLDLKKAIEYFQLSAAQGNAFALCNLGVSYCKGIGVQRDEKKGFGYFQQAAVQGFAVAQYFIGHCFQHGDGVAKDLKRAFEYFQLADAQGSIDSAKLASSSDFVYQRT